MRRSILLLCFAALVLPGAAVSSAPASIPAGGTVLAVAQNGGDVAWLADGGSGCALETRTSAGKTTTEKLKFCLLPEADLAFAGGRWAWGGYEDVRCSETTAAVYETAGKSAKLVQEIPGDCFGYDTSYRGLASDGHAFYYSLLTTKSGDAAVRCENTGPCRWQLAGGKLVRIGGGEVSGLPPAALIAGAPGRLALVQAASTAFSKGQTADWPRAATNGRVDVRDTGTGKLVTSFQPKGIVRAVALSTTRAVVLVQAGSAWRIEWYDPATGKRLGSALVPKASHLSTDGSLAAFAAGQTVRVLDLQSGTLRIVGHAAKPLYAVSVQGHQVVWGDGSQVVLAAA